MLTKSLLVIVPINQVPKVIALKTAIFQPLSQEELSNGALTAENRHRDRALGDGGTRREARDDQVAV